MKWFTRRMTTPQTEEAMSPVDAPIQHESPKSYVPEVVTIAGVRFQREAGGLLRLIDQSAEIVRDTDVCQMYVFESHNGRRYSNSYVMGEWCINGCQAFHQSDAQHVFDDFNVPSMYQADITSSFQPFTMQTPSVTNDENYNRLLVLNGVMLKADKSSDFTTRVNYLLKNKDDDVIYEYFMKLHHTNPLLVERVLDAMSVTHLTEHRELFKKLSTHFKLPQNIMFYITDGVERLKTVISGDYHESYFYHALNECEAVTEEDLASANVRLLKNLHYIADQHHDVVKEVLIKYHVRFVFDDEQQFKYVCHEPRLAKGFSCNRYSCVTIMTLLSYKPCIEVVQSLYDAYKADHELKPEHSDVICKVLESFYDLK